MSGDSIDSACRDPEESWLGGPTKRRRGVASRMWSKIGGWYGILMGLLGAAVALGVTWGVTTTTLSYKIEGVSVALAEHRKETAPHIGTVNKDQFEAVVKQLETLTTAVQRQTENVDKLMLGQARGDERMETVRGQLEYLIGKHRR